VLVPEKFVPHFKPGKDLRERVDGRAGEPLKAQDSSEGDEDDDS
jgi:integration host factor subunit beta